MGMIVGGPRAWKKHKIGQFILAFHWVNNEGSMVIAAHKRPNTPAIIIGQSMAHEYADSKSGDPTPYCAHKCLEYVGAMGLLKMEAPKLMQLIVEAIPDLLEMPPEPDWEKLESSSKAVDNAVASLIADGKTVFETPLRLQ